MICDDQFINALLLLWNQLQLIEGVRRILIKYVGDTVALEKNSSVLKNAAQSALPLATTLCQKVEVAIEKIKPLVGTT